MIKDWTNTTLKEFIEIQKITDSELSEFDKTVEILNVLYKKDFNKEKLTDYMEAVKNLNFLKEKLPKMKVKKTLEINGKKFNLLINQEDITTAQFIDYNNIVKMDKKQEEKYIDFLSVFITPEGKTYADKYDMEELKKDLEEMPYALASSISAFFLRKYKRYLTRFQIFLTIKALKSKKTWKEKKAAIKALGNLSNAMDFSLML